MVLCFIVCRRGEWIWIWSFVHWDLSVFDFIFEDLFFEFEFLFLQIFLLDLIIGFNACLDQEFQKG